MICHRLVCWLAIHNSVEISDSFSYTEATSSRLIINPKGCGSPYGNPGIGGSCGGLSEDGGVIGFGDKGDIGFGLGGGGIGDDAGVGVVVVVAVVVVTFFIVFGIPHICDSVVLTNLSFGLLGSHSFDFSCGDMVELGDGSGEVDGDGVIGGVFCSNWA